MRRRQKEKRQQENKKGTYREFYSLVTIKSFFLLFYFYFHLICSFGYTYSRCYTYMNVIVTIIEPRVDKCVLNVWINNF